MLAEILFNLPECAIVALIDKDTKSVYLFHSKESIVALGRHVKLLRLNSHSCSALQDAFDRNALDLVTHGFPSDCSNSFLKAQYGVILSEYRNKGYNDMRKGYTPGSYKLSIGAMNDFRLLVGNDKRTDKFLVYVSAVSIRKDKEILGVFESMDDAEAWVKANYTSRDNIVPVRCNNDLTRIYYESQHTTIPGWHIGWNGKVTL